MSDIEAIEVLQQAKERIFEDGWHTGNSTSSTVGWCLEEALLGQKRSFLGTCFSENPVYLRAGGYVAQAVDHPSEGKGIWWWNDMQHSAGPVLDAIDKAIALAKEAE